METLSVHTPRPELLKMSLSGGPASKAWFQTVNELCDTETPKIAIDSSALVGSKLYETQRNDYTDAFKRHGLPDAMWLQHTPDSLLSPSFVEGTLAAADALLVLGGSTDLLYKRWKRAGVVKTMTQAVLNGSVVACGGSAGAMIWFEQGYSDSGKYVCGPNQQWNYGLIESAGVLGALVTVHYSDTDAFGRLRSQGFKLSLDDNNRLCQRAIGLDSSAALYVNDGVMTVKDINPIGCNDNANAYLYGSENELQTLAPGSNLRLVASSE
ncbi:MAG: Type 1 glutamine amidotransferase-like domain-containing protein [Candidatus Saccharimonadales bacterium]